MKTTTKTPSRSYDYLVWEGPPKGLACLISTPRAAFDDVPCEAPWTRPLAVRYAAHQPLYQRRPGTVIGVDRRRSGTEQPWREHLLYVVGHDGRAVRVRRVDASVVRASKLLMEKPR